LLFQVFLKTAEALKIKGIVDCVETEESSSNSRRPSSSSSSGSQAAPPPPLTPPIADSLSAEQIPPPPTNCVSDAVTSAAVPLADLAPLQHPAGDLSLLATAAASALAAAAAAAASTPPLPTAAAGAAVMDYAPSAGGALPPNPKRRKTAPRKLGSFLSSSPSHEPFRSVTNVKFSILVIAFILPRPCTGTGFSMNTTVTVSYTPCRLLLRVHLDICLPSAGGFFATHFFLLIVLFLL
jgi:hypothetical protein